VKYLYRLGTIKNNFMESEEDDDDDMEEEDEDELVSKTGKSGSNRVRTMISDEQLAILKTRYSDNPKPRREDLVQIAADIGHPFKVVKVYNSNYHGPVGFC
jgi:hypothetical protein